jgi:hypothetical protein
VAKVKVQPKNAPAVPATYRAPAPPPPPPPPDTTAPAVAPAPPADTKPAVTKPAVTQPAAAKPAACYPLTNGGNCYEPGEFCRAADHGSSGVAGDGAAITCENNNGWRWEPS